ncbi:hypothetical protein ACEWY4_016996 [Coilia grayii]|uniref:TSC22 domain family protein 1 n=1 Tax=Coilia grayii TaxID=363190 RepID=A0ABD1JLZ7_9TELE
MHHADSTGDSPGLRKMAHSSVFSSRRGSNTGSGSGLSNAANANINANVIQTDDNQTPLLSQHAAPAGSSSPGPHHPPHSLNVPSQSLQSAGAQVKKKSGFQITSVLPAQVSASANNSIADDTESYDDMDESHTEDLSSSDMLDVSVSRATDHGVPERSSSEETLNSLHGVETPGVVSPNEPVLHHAMPQGAQQGYLVNGSVHHPGHHHHSHQPHHGHHQDLPHAVATSAAVAAPSGALPVVQGTVGVTATPVLPSSGLGSGQIVRPIPVRPVPLNGAAAGLVGQPPASTKVPVSIGQSGALGVVGGGGVVPGAGSGLSGGGGAQPGSAGVNPATSQPMPTSTSAHSQASAAPLAASSSTTTTAAASGSTSTASRFRVVKLDSNSEPYRKGRWTCTEYYEKEAPPSVTSAATTTTSTSESVSASVMATSATVGAPAGAVAPQPTAPESDSTTSGSSSVGSTLGESGMALGQPSVYAGQASHPGGHHPHATQQGLGQDTGVMPPIHPATMQAMPHGVGVPGAEGQSAAVRPQQPMGYHVEAPPGQGQMGYPAAQQPNAAGMTHAGVQQAQDFSQGHPPGMQAAGQQPHGMVPLQPRPVAPHPQAPAGQPPPLQHPAQIHAEPQQPPQHAGGVPVSAAAATSQSVPAMPAPQPHPAVGLGHPGAALLAGGMGLALAPQGHLAPGGGGGGGGYAGASSLTASQLEDAQRLLFQQSLPRLATATTAEGAVGMDTGGLTAATGAEEDR